MRSKRLFRRYAVSVPLVKKRPLAFAFVLACLVCFSVVPQALGFMTFDHEFRIHFIVLLDKVHAPHWNIVYAYGDDCPPEARNNDAALTAAISKALRTWLQPLHGYTAKPIVNDFRYQPTADDAGARVAADLWIFFHCEHRNSTAHTGGNSPGIHLRSGTKVVQHFMDSLVHETGHVFGLSDTYIPWADRHKPGLSKGGLVLTRGTQPASVMSLHVPYFGVEAVNDPVPLDGIDFIGVDDINGILWLYKHVHEGLPLEDCFFRDYELEEEPLGCRPKYPLIFEIKQVGEYPLLFKGTKQSDGVWARNIMDEDRTIDINAQDAEGLTALHYAVVYGFEELVAKLIAHKDIVPFLRDNEGRSALQIARENKLDRMITLLLEHPLTLPVHPKGKLTTTWGHLKKQY